MEIFIRLLVLLFRFISFVLTLLGITQRGDKNAKQLPPIENSLLKLSIRELQQKLRNRKLTSVELVEAYIERIKAVNPLLNAVIADCFAAALVEAKRADKLILAQPTDAELENLFTQQPLLGLPMTVKESCALSGMSFEVGSLARSGFKAKADGTTVKRLRDAGAIPLLVSATPEYCYSIESFSYTNGRCQNPYNLNRTPGGSSGGEGALNGAGASLFGVGSDIGGSIRIPSLFCGIFGHKPTGGVVSVEGHFPDSSDEDIEEYLQLGPMTRFACDLNLLLEVMAGNNACKLSLDQPVDIKKIRVHYALGFDGLNGLIHPSVEPDLKDAVLRATKHCESLGITVGNASFSGMQNSMEIGFSGIARLKTMPHLINENNNCHVLATLKELLKGFAGRSKYTLNSLNFELLRRANAFMSEEKLAKYALEGQQLKKEFVALLGSDGVLLFPTLHVPAIPHNSSMTGALWGVDYTLIFNILGLPVTHVPMGLGREGLPVGISVIAAPYQDRLCIRMAQELEEAFGGWVPPQCN